MSILTDLIGPQGQALPVILIALAITLIPIAGDKP
jgi:hypothetical protein